jgi:hypothetical protein
LNTFQGNLVVRRVIGRELFDLRGFDKILGAAVVAAISTQAQVLGLNTFGEMQPL